MTPKRRFLSFVFACLSLQTVSSSLIYLFIYLFVYLFIYLFIYLFVYYFLLIDWFVVVRHAGIFSEMCAILLHCISFAKNVSCSAETYTPDLD